MAVLLDTCYKLVYVYCTLRNCGSATKDDIDFVTFVILTQEILGMLLDLFLLEIPWQKLVEMKFSPEYFLVNFEIMYNIEDIRVSRGFKRIRVLDTIKRKI